MSNPSGGKSHAAEVARKLAWKAWSQGSARLADAVGSPLLGQAVRIGNKLIEKVGMRRLLIGCLATVMLLCCPQAMAMGLIVTHSMSAPVTMPECQGPAEPAGGASTVLTELDREQRMNAELIVLVGLRIDAPPRAWVIAVATAMQESSLRNLPHLGEDNDHDSLGLFQQRPSQGWGTAQEIRDPEYATTAFYDRLLELTGWQDMALADAAQAVQGSAHPEAYAARAGLAADAVAWVTGDPALAAMAGDLRCADWEDVTGAGWTAPVFGPVWSGFRTANRPQHYGIDIGADRGTPIRAAADGRVVVAKCNATYQGRPYSCDRDGSPEVAGCGWYVDILHAGQVSSRYCHMGQRPVVEIGEEVVAGKVIGFVGSSGRSSGPHLHFEIVMRRSIDEHSGPAWQPRQVDPIEFLAEHGVHLRCEGAAADCRPVHGDRARRD